MLLFQEFDIEIRDKKGVENSVFPPEASYLYKVKLQSDAKYYIWDDPYFWSLYSDKVIRRCIPKIEINSVLQFCHLAPGGATMDQLELPGKCLIVGSIGPLFLETLISSSTPTTNARKSEWP
ncbi:hypothetical protein CR513_52546, partial [Mucuna pruriens]